MLTGWHQLKVFLVFVVSGIADKRRMTQQIPFESFEEMWVKFGFKGECVSEAAKLLLQVRQLLAGLLQLSFHLRIFEIWDRICWFESYILCLFRFPWNYVRFFFWKKFNLETDRYNVFKFSIFESFFIFQQRQIFKTELRIRIIKHAIFLIANRSIHCQQALIFKMKTAHARFINRSIDLCIPTWDELAMLIERWIIS